MLKPDSESESESTLRPLDWGLIGYEMALRQQEHLVEEVAASGEPGYLIFCSHPPVVTRGRKTLDDDVFGWEGQMVTVSRGGRATYHGPSQEVIYPIFNLKRSERARSLGVVGVVRKLEQAIVETLAEYGVAASGKQAPALENGPSSTSSNGEETGVWVNERKVASLGIAVRHWVSFHGAALNVDWDPRAFQGLKPCGLRSEVMISLEELLGHRVDRGPLRQRLRTKINQLLR
ncbi:MAG: lipoyl(octanoyl) transferase [Bdellovibrio sp.]|nr:MAG: lipoyl(octanoyl) transferase [Bdellovibrio sp.]